MPKIPTGGAKTPTNERHVDAKKRKLACRVKDSVGREGEGRDVNTTALKIEDKEGQMCTTKEVQWYHLPATYETSEVETCLLSVGTPWPLQNNLVYAGGHPTLCVTLLTLVPATDSTKGSRRLTSFMRTYTL